MPAATLLSHARSRRRRPPKALMFLVCTYLVSLGWICDCVLLAVSGRSNGLELAICAVVAAFWAQRSLSQHRELRRALREHQADRSLGWSPRPVDWSQLALSAAVMAWVPLALATGFLLIGS